ncbi:MAG TPA: NUDIX domain-containing protein, partial [Bryobacteraceae bacterium]
LEGVLLVVRRAGRVLLRQRAADARRMADFWELPSPEDLPKAKQGAEFGEIRHTITHHHYRLAVRAAQGGASGLGFRWFEPRALAEIPLSTTARKALKLAGIL